jgi:hypothetical protein
MAAPNIVNVSTITAKTAQIKLSGTSATEVVSNPASSGKVFKLNNIIVSNIDGSAAATITVAIENNATVGSGTSTYLAYTINVPADATLVLIDKSTAVYLEENHNINATASAGNDLDVVCSYEEIS